MTMPMTRVRQHFTVQACLLGASLLFALGCGSSSTSGGGMSVIGLTADPANVASTATPTIDAGQSIPLLAGVVNDSTRAGATFTLTGPGTVAAGATTDVGDSEQITATYTAPATVSAATSATVTAASVHTPSETASVVITINPAMAITTASLPNGFAGTSYTSTLSSTGGTPSITWALASGTLPTGLGLSTTGVISGTPTAAGSFTFSVSATDKATSPNTVTQAYSIKIAPSVTTQSLPNGVAGTAYSQQLSSAGSGSSTPTFALATGSLPAGLTLSSTGLISGTPATASAGSTFNFAVTVTVGGQTSAADALSITIDALPAITTLSVPSGNIGIAYSQQLTYSGGSGGAVTWSLASGTLPAGITLSASGLLSGMPSSATTYNFSVTVTVGTQTSAAQAYTLVINSLIVTSGSAASGELALPFAFHLTAVGGTAPYSWKLATGSAALPAGLALNAATGLISGTPTTVTGSPFSGITVQATDSLSATATQAMTFTISAARAASMNSEMTGQYVFLLSGFDGNGKPLASAGSFTADGNGNITAGTIDLNGTGLAAPALDVAITTGTYAVGPDNRGKLTLTTAAATYTYVLALDGISSGVASAGYLSEFDATTATLTGKLALQSQPSFSVASVTGGFAFGLTGFAANSSAASMLHRSVIGETQFNATSSIASAEYLSSSSTTAAPITPISGSLAVAANGRGTLSYTLPSGAGKIDLVVYLVSPTQYFALSADAASGPSASDLLSGQALQQTTTNGNFNALSLNGISVLRAEKLDVTASGALYPDVQIGLFSFNGSGKLSLSSDENAGGVVTTYSPAGTYTVSPNGRVTVSLATALGGCADCVSDQTFFYLVGTGQGFLMDYSGPVTTGYFEPQTATTFNAGSLSGSYATGALEPLSVATSNATGAIVSNGAGALTGTIDVNGGGTLVPDTAITGSYTVGSNGRTTATLSNGTKPVVYVISAAKALFIDTSTTAPVVQEIAH